MNLVIQIQWLPPFGYWLWGINMKNKKKKSLAGKIVWIAVILIFAGLLEVAVGYTLLDKYHVQVADMEYKLTEVYMTKINQNFNMINTSVRSMLFDGQEIKKVSEAYKKAAPYYNDAGALGDVLVQNSSVTELKNTFLSMSQNYGNTFNFFYYDTVNERLTEYGGCEYYVRKPFIDRILEMIGSDTMVYTKEGKWFLYDEYLCTIYKGPNGIAGAWIRALDFARNMLELSPTQCSSIEIYDSGQDQTLVYTRQKNGTLALSLSNKTQESYYGMNNARFECRFIMDTRDYDSTFLYPMIFLALIIIYLIIVSGVLIYTKKNILGQVRYFYDNLLAFKDTARFNEESGLVEFSEAGKVLNQLSEEIHKLKIDIYEEQIAKQRVELDYAQLQIRPHFYINCLNIIYSMAQVNRMKEIQEIALQVSGYLRYIFKKSMEPVTVKGELDFTQSYLKVLECMNDTKYECHIYADETLYDFGIPPLLIQTFVENSLKHNMDNENGCALSICLERVCCEDKSGCGITISDDGKGFSAGALEALNAGAFSRNASYHIGIRNAVARLNMLYGPDCAVRFFNNSQGGASVFLFIPDKNGLSDTAGNREDQA